MRPPSPRGPLSHALRRCLEEGTPVHPTAWRRIVDRLDPGGVLLDEDVQVSLWTLYELHYRGFGTVPADREWDPDLIGVRVLLEGAFEAALRSRVGDQVAAASAAADDVPGQIEHLVGTAGGPSLARHLQREATLAQVREYLAARSLFHLKESDPTAFVLPRLDGGPKAALAELLYDEYGGGRAARLHAHLFARALAGCGLDPTYGAYVDRVPADTLAVNNAMSLFGLHRRLRGAALGHLAAFETTSSLPSRRIVAGLQRLGLPRTVWEYFDEHVEADAVHEQVALRDICGALVAAEPALREDVLTGAAVCLSLDALVAERTLTCWRAGGSTLREPAAAMAALAPVEAVGA